MINDIGQIEVRVGHTFSDGDNEYRAIRLWDCSLCVFKEYNDPCLFLACMCNEREDSCGVHFIKEGGKQC